MLRLRARAPAKFTTAPVGGSSRRALEKAGWTDQGCRPVRGQRGFRLTVAMIAMHDLGHRRTTCSTSTAVPARSAIRSGRAARASSATLINGAADVNGLKKRPRLDLPGRRRGNRRWRWSWSELRLGRLNHVGVATPSIAASVAYYRDVMGAGTIGEPFDLPAQGVKVCFVDAPNVQVELIEPLGETSPIHGFLARNPAGGQHHMCYEVPDIHEAKAWFEEQRCAKLLGEPRIGAHGTLDLLRPSQGHERGAYPRSWRHRSEADGTLRSLKPTRARIQRRRAQAA